MLEEEPEQLDTQGALDVKLSRQGTQIQLTGRVKEEYLDTETRIYLRINGAGTYEAFPMDAVVGEETDSGGFCLYLSQQSVLSKGTVWK